MDTELRPSTLEIIELLESATGLPAQVTAVASLDTIAVVKPARGAQAAHHVMFNPMADEPPDYLICHECGIALRQYAPPPEDRVEMAPDEQGRQRVEEQLRGPKGPVHRYRLDDERTASLRDKLYGGMMLQLRSTPVGLRVDEWLMEHYPDLGDLQESFAMGKMADDLAILSADVRSITPPRPLMASLALNGAYAEFWSRLWGQPELVTPYRDPGSYRDARALMRSFDAAPDDPAHDTALIDEWALTLGLSGWYRWRTFPTPSAPTVTPPRAAS
ncbi:MAG: hypothetical protein ACK2UL_04425 [Anaerolineae bacterium]